MKDQHKNKLLEILRGEKRDDREIESPAQMLKMRGKTGIAGQRPAGQQEKPSRRGLVTILRAELERQMAVYEWRTRTNQPLLAAHCTEVQLRQGQPFLSPSDLRSRLARSPVAHDETVVMRVETEPSSAISTLMPLPISQHLYCLKEALYGFQQLHICFGRFNPSPFAIRFTADGRVKVWLSLPLQRNPLNESAQKDEERLVGDILRVFQGWKMETGVFRQFYEGIQGHHTFLQVQRYIAAFIQRNKIKIDKRIMARGRQPNTRPQSPKAELRRVPKFLSPSALQPNASIRHSLGVNVPARRQQQQQPSSPSPSPEKPESISLKKTTETRSPRRVNLVRTEKHRKGSDNGFCFTSLHRLQATRENLLGQAKISEICFQNSGQVDTMASLNVGNSLLRNVEQLFEEQDELDCLSVSVEMEQAGKVGKKGKRLANYGRKVNESFINTHPRQ